jgi:hypothetical protein
MCLLKNIKIECDDLSNELLCSKHKTIYKIWCEAGGYLKLLVNNVDASEIENIEYFKKILVDIKFELEDLDLESKKDKDELHHLFQTQTL